MTEYIEHQVQLHTRKKEKDMETTTHPQAGQHVHKMSQYHD